jgi:putative heme iron utilization protein
MGEAETSATAARARRLIRSADRAALATALREAGGWPFASLVLCACDAAGAPLLFLSTLAEHTRNLAKDPRVSLLYDATAGLEDPLAGARVTVLGSAEPCRDARARARYLARHPSAEVYAGFADFTLYRVRVERAHLVAGFGAIDWIDGGALIAERRDGDPSATTG